MATRMTSANADLARVLPMVASPRYFTRLCQERSGRDVVSDLVASLTEYIEAAHDVLAARKSSAKTVMVKRLKRSFSSAKQIRKVLLRSDGFIPLKAVTLARKTIAALGRPEPPEGWDYHAGPRQTGQQLVKHRPFEFDEE